MVDALEQVNDVTITFVDEDGEKSNNNINITEKSRECPICHVYYKYGNSYWQHVRYVHASYLSQCVICEKCYKRSTMAKHHVLHSHKIAWHLCGNYSFNCYDCDGSFSTIKDLFDHVKNHKKDFDEIKSSDDNETIDTDAEKTTVS
ncbi:Gastrula zinc finger protein XLCGF71.1, putative [Pediculus humanus corporis]|uniref:Gastrula zinc finger protein XLCGF71.1, putative n=1 Tax=Pediculus humanus subsp. corporis TaxID=121224 RepID=E0W0M2_PEDHC|nr:Gastrula zinc finger protein XLCGF71.1, putative [Pediculus humanus corporis]EEB19178.1 Gastrula zinc finger protein XLCGF71.1, putative [Pediculus humanus corporis]